MSKMVKGMEILLNLLNILSPFYSILQLTKSYILWKKSTKENDKNAFNFPLHPPTGI